MTPRFPESAKRITSLRLTAQRLARPHGTPAEVVRHLLAVQAQDWFGSLWSVAQRSPGATAADVEQALASGAVVRSWPMRGTLHLVAAEDIGWMTSVTSPRLIQGGATRSRDLELDDADYARAEAIARDRLDGVSADRAEVLAAFEAGGLSTAGQRGYHLLGRLAQQAVTVMVSRADYALHDQWVREPRRLERTDALAEFAERFIRSHGPATAPDLARWASLTLTDARAGLAAVRDRLESVEIDGVEHWQQPGLEPAEPAVLLLAGFDEYLLGYGDRGAPLGGEPDERVVPGKNGMFLPTVVVDGRVMGTWKRTLRPGRVDLAIDRWHAIPARREPALRRAAAAYGAHLGLEARLTG